jgi:RNA polymerase sigma factor (sigma-70 family)
LADGKERARSLRPRRLAEAVVRLQPDSRLLRLLLDGSDAAFDELFRRYWGPLLAYATTICPSQADDIAQEAMMKAYRALAAGEPVRELRPWLYRIVHNTGVNALRASDRRDELDPGFEPPRAEPWEALEQSQNLAALTAQLKALPEAQREAIVKRELGGLSYGNIALELGVSTGAVRQLIFRARESLRNAAGLLVPVPLVRLLASPTYAELAGAGAAGAGIGGAVALKGGMTVAAVAGALFVGAGLYGGDGDRQPAGADRDSGRAAAPFASPADDALAAANPIATAPATGSTAADQGSEPAASGAAVGAQGAGSHGGEGATAPVLVSGGGQAQSPVVEPDPPPGDHDAGAAPAVPSEGGGPPRGHGHAYGHGDRRARGHAYGHARADEGHPARDEERADSSCAGGAGGPGDGEDGFDADQPAAGAGPAPCAEVAAPAAPQPASGVHLPRPNISGR